MLSVFKLVSCKPEASRELALRPPTPEELNILYVHFSYVIVFVVNRNKFNFVGFLIVPKLLIL